MGIQEKIREIEEEIARTQKNKATEFHLGVLKAQLAKLRRELLSPRKSGGGGGFEVRKSGDATVVMIGLPSVGKSTLLSKLTKAESKVGAYAFTTLKCIPGILEYKKAKIQVLDLPGIIKGARHGKGRGREIISVARNADLLLILVEAAHPEQYEVIMRELRGFGIRVNEHPPDVSITKLAQGGLSITFAVKLKKGEKLKISEKEVRAVLGEYGIYNGNVVIRENITVEQLIDVLEGNRKYVPGLVVVTKADTVDKKVLEKYPIKYDVAVSYEDERSIEKLKEMIYEKLNLINVYTKRKDEEVDYSEPLVIRKGSTVRDVCRKLHRELLENFRYALVWGKSVKHQPQRVGLNHVLEDGDVIRIIKRTGGR